MNTFGDFLMHPLTEIAKEEHHFYKKLAMLQACSLEDAHLQIKDNLINNPRIQATSKMLKMS